MIDRIARTMTYGGACTAAGCGYANGGTLIAGPVMSLSDWGLLIGICVGLFGAIIQYMSWLDRRDTKRQEDELRCAERAYLLAKENRERIEHEMWVAQGHRERRDA